MIYSERKPSVSFAQARTAYAENAGADRPALDGEILPPDPKQTMLDEIYKAAEGKLPLRRAPEMITLTPRR